MRLLLALLLVLCASVVEAQTPTPTETPTPTPCVEYACTGTVMSADFAGCPVLALRNGDSCTLGDGFTRPDLEINLYEGSLTTNDKTFTAKTLSYLVATGTVNLDLTTSTITVENYGGTISGGVTVNVTPGTSLLKISVVIAPHDKPIHDLEILPSSVTLGAVGTANDVTFDPGSIVTSNPGFITQYNWHSLTCLGTGGSPIVLDGPGSPPFPDLALAAQAACTHITVTNVGCGGGAVPCNAADSTDGGNTTGWCFGDSTACPAVTWTPTITPTETPTPIPTDTPTITPTVPATDCSATANICLWPDNCLACVFGSGVPAECAAVAGACAGCPGTCPNDTSCSAWVIANCGAPDACNCAAAGPSPTPTVGGATPTITKTPTRTRTPTQTGTVTNTPTVTPTGTWNTSAGHPSLLNQACPTPPCWGTPYPEMDGHKTANTSVYAGNCTTQVYCRDASPQSTPVPVCTPITNTGLCEFDDSCWYAFCAVIAGGDASCRESCWIENWSGWTQ